MSNILIANISIQGLRPMLWHAFGPDAIPLEKKEKAGVAGNDPTEWTRTMLITSSRQLYIKNEQVFGCLRDAAIHSKRGKGTLQPFLTATLQVEPAAILIDDRFVPEEPVADANLPVYLDIRPVKNPSTKGRNIRYRIAAAPGWECSFMLSWDKTIVSRGELEKVLIDAGQLIGLGNARKLGYGRFRICICEIRDAQ